MLTQFDSPLIKRIKIPNHSIVEVVYGGITLFEDGQILDDDLMIGANNNMLGNDSLSDPGIIELRKTLPESALNRDLQIRYKIDGSCEIINSVAAELTSASLERRWSRIR